MTCPLWKVGLNLLSPPVLLVFTLLLRWRLPPRLILSALLCRTSPFSSPWVLPSSWPLTCLFVGSDQGLSLRFFPFPGYFTSEKDWLRRFARHSFLPGDRSLKCFWVFFRWSSSFDSLSLPYHVMFVRFPYCHNVAPFLIEMVHPHFVLTILRLCSLLFLCIF